MADTGETNPDDVNLSVPEVPKKEADPVIQEINQRFEITLILITLSNNNY